MIEMMNRAIARSKLRRKLQKRNDNKDHKILLRQAKAINAEVEWIRFHNRLEIIVRAPIGFVWANCNEQTLIQTTERSDPAYTREAVSDLLAAMAEGFNPSGRPFEQCTGETTCECEICESSDEEISELGF